MASQEALEKMSIRQGFSNLWHTDLLSAIGADPAYCCFATLCPHCVSYLLRKRALYDDMSRYTCCGGYMPCSGKCGERNCPEICLCTEVFLCFANSVASTRFMLQDEFNIQTTQCDNCIIGFMFCLQQLACIFSLAACLTGIDELEEASQLLSCLSDLVYCSVCSCMQTQHKVEMDKRDGKFGPQPVMAPPSPQHMSRVVDQPYPPLPPSGYPPPPSSGYPPPPVYQQMCGYPPPANPYAYPPPAPGYPAHTPSGYPAPSPQHSPAHHHSPSGYPAHHHSPTGYPAPSPQHSPAHSPHHSPDYPPNPPGYPQHSPDYPPNPPPGYPQHSPHYPPNPPSYPPNPPAYPPNPPPYPQQSPGYPAPGTDYPPPPPYPPKSDSK